MTAAGVGMSTLTDFPSYAVPLQNGLTSAAIGLIALAALRLTQKLVSSKADRVLVLVSASLAICYSSFSWLYPLVMFFSGVASFVIDWLENYSQLQAEFSDSPYARVSVSESPDIEADQELEEDGELDGFEELDMDLSVTGSMALILIFVLILIVSLVCRNLESRAAQIFGSFYFVGSIIFGGIHALLSYLSGGPVVIPLLQHFTLQHGWMSEHEFLLGLAIISTMPGPMFNFSAYLGALALRKSPTYSILGAILAYLGIFTPVHISPLTRLILKTQGLILQTALIPVYHFSFNITFPTSSGTDIVGGRIFEHSFLELPWPLLG